MTVLTVFRKLCPATLPGKVEILECM